MTRRAIESATQQERLSYATLIEELRKQRKLTQIELGEASGVSARTIRNIEKGVVAPQTDKLIALLIALDVSLDEDEYLDVLPYTRVIAPIIRRIHPDHRDEAVAKVIDGLADFVILYPHAGRSNVTRLRPDVRPHTDDDYDVTHEPVDPTTLRHAADTSPKKSDLPYAE